MAQKSNDPIANGKTLTAEALNAAFPKNPEGFSARIARPNLIRRLLWRALGVTWTDLRPERDMETLRKLK